MYPDMSYNECIRNQKCCLFCLSSFFAGGEWSDSSKFALCTIVCHSFFPLGLMLLSGIAFWIRNWRILQMVLFSPLVIVLGIFYWSATFLTTYNVFHFTRTNKAECTVCFSLSSWTYCICQLGFFLSRLAGS